MVCLIARIPSREANAHRVTASTISRLYEAQRQHPRAEPVPSQPQPNVYAIPAADRQTKQKSTLHAFWNISSAPVAARSLVATDSTLPSRNEWEWRCEDCDSSLRSTDAMDLDEGAVEEETSCFLCRRYVCNGCAVLGDERVCLACANRSVR